MGIVYASNMSTCHRTGCPLGLVHPNILWDAFTNEGKAVNILWDAFINEGKAVMAATQTFLAVAREHFEVWDFNDPRLITDFYAVVNGAVPTTRSAKTNRTSLCLIHVDCHNGAHELIWAATTEDGWRIS